MKLSVIMTILLLCIIHLLQVTAKSHPAIVNHDGKMRYSQKQNSVSTTSKPEIHYQSLQQYQNVQSDKQQSHFTQNVPVVVPQQLQPVTLQPVQLQQQLVHPLPVPVQTQLHPQSQQQILQLIQKVLYNTQQSNQPTAMIIIAQPAYLPANVVFGNTAQQLLNYFHNNPQARYQFVHGTQQSQPVQYIPQPQPIQMTQPMTTYPVIPAPAHYQSQLLPLHTSVSHTTHMSPVHPSESYNQQVPLQLHQISQVANAAAQQYYPQSRLQLESRQNDVDYHSSIPPIITGLENFSPEQQEKIKVQLSAHFGAPLQPLPVGQKDAGSSKYQLNTNEFIPSPELKSGSNVMNTSKKTYTKV